MCPNNLARIFFEDRTWVADYCGDSYGWGSSPYCIDGDGDYICDDSYVLEGGNIDTLPLKEFRDQDNDGVADADDNCASVPNPGQDNADGDRYGDACDNCWLVMNDTQVDTNNNCPSPPYATDPLCGDACEPSDTDGDGIPDVNDNCPSAYNPGQENSDGDQVGDACDNCSAVSNPDQNNWDGDSLGNACDNCWSISNLDQTDTDGDCSGYSQPYAIDPFCGDGCDQCPSDPEDTSGYLRLRHTGYSFGTATTAFRIVSTIALLMGARQSREFVVAECPIRTLTMTGIYSATTIAPIFETTKQIQTVMA